MIDRENETIHPEGCLTGTVLGLIITLMLIVMMLSSCAPLHALHPEGEVKQVEQNRIEVAFPDALHTGRHGHAWFFFPGIGEADTADYTVIIQLIPKKP